jgi:hypothetical protein
MLSGSRRFTELGRGFLAVCVAFSFAAAPILGAAHLAAVDHVTCPQDGELIDVPHTRVVPRAALMRHGSALNSTEGDVPTGEHSHGHCAFATHALPRTTATAPAPAASPVPLIDADSNRSAILSPLWSRSVAVYRVAPKSSPPAV